MIIALPEHKTIVEALEVRLDKVSANGDFKIKVLVNGVRGRVYNSYIGRVYNNYIILPVTFFADDANVIYNAITTAIAEANASNAVAVISSDDLHKQLMEE